MKIVNGLAQWFSINVISITAHAHFCALSIMQ